MRSSSSCTAIIKHFESLHDGDMTRIGLQPKMCPAGIWTVGYGHALRNIDGSFLKGIDGYARMISIYPDLETITEDEANDLLESDLSSFESKINSLNLNLTQYQFDAIVSFTFNVGFGNLLSSTLLKRIREGRGDIHDAFLMWNKSGGKELRGLTRRREAEADLYMCGELYLSN